MPELPQEDIRPRSIRLHVPGPWFSEGVLLLRRAGDGGEGAALANTDTPVRHVQDEGELVQAAYQTMSTRHAANIAAVVIVATVNGSRVLGRDACWRTHVASEDQGAPSYAQQAINSTAVGDPPVTSASSAPAKLTRTPTPTSGFGRATPQTSTIQREMIEGARAAANAALQSPLFHRLVRRRAS